MIDLEILAKYQQRLLDINSANYKFDILQNSINYIDKLVLNGEFDFLPLSDDVDGIYSKNNYFYDFLENKLSKLNANQVSYTGYNKLNIEALLHKIVKPETEYIIHDDMYSNLSIIYKQYFSNLSEHSIYSIFHNNFKVDTINISNYLKVCFNKEQLEFDYRIAQFYIAPMYEFSKMCTSQILTSIKKESYTDLLNTFSNSVLYLNNIDGFNGKLSEFINKNIFNNYDFNDSYKDIITNSVKIDNLLGLFNDYISILSKNNLFKVVNNIYYDFVQEFAYILMTHGRQEGIVTFNTPEDIYTNLIFAVRKIVNAESQYIIDLLKNKVIPEIIFPINHNVYFIRIDGHDFKISKTLTPLTFDYISYVLAFSSTRDKYSILLQKLNELFYRIYNGDTLSLNKRVYTKYELEQKIKTTQFFSPDELLVVTEQNSIYKTLTQDVLKRMNDLKSIVTITYNYRDEPLQFINSTLAVFNDWTDLILKTQYNNTDYINACTDSDISTIIGSIDFDKDKLLEFINTEFVNRFSESKVIELNFYRYFGELVDDFIQTHTFKKFIINEFIEPIAISLKTRSPKLYKEIYQNIDNIINYVKFLLITKMYDSLDLHSVYRYIIKDIEISNFDNDKITEIIYRFKDLNSVSINKYKQDITKFTTSMAVLLLLDKYIDGFRIIKKFKTFDILKVSQNKNIVTVELNDTHSLSRGRGVTISNNSGNINGYKIINTIVTPTSFTFVQNDPKLGSGGSVDIRQLDV